MLRSCKNTYCTRRVIACNPLDLCHKCIEVANTVRWLIEAGVLSQRPGVLQRFKDAGLVAPAGLGSS
jgi:hypothetical protein